MRMIIISMILQTLILKMRIIDIIKKLTTKNESNGIAVDNEQHQSAPNEQNSDSNDEKQ